MAFKNQINFKQFLQIQCKEKKKKESNKNNFFEKKKKKNTNLNFICIEIIPKAAPKF